MSEEQRFVSHACLESIKRKRRQAAANHVQLENLLILLNALVTALIVQQGTTKTWEEKEPLNVKLVGKESTTSRAVLPRKISRVKTVPQDITSPQRVHLMIVSSALLAHLVSTLFKLAEAT